MNIIHPAVMGDEINMDYIHPEYRKEVEQEIVRRQSVRTYRRRRSNNVRRKDRNDGCTAPLLCPKCNRVWESYSRGGWNNEIVYHLHFPKYGLERSICPECK